MKHEKLLESRDKVIYEGVRLDANGDAHTLDDDNFSIMTTDSDRLYASSVVNRVMKQKYFQISQQKALSQKQEAERTKASERLKQQRRVGKQVDVNWLQRKQQLVPTANDLEIFEPAEPLVTMELVSSPDFTINESESKRIMKQNKDAFRLQGHIDSTSAQPAYTMSISTDDIFGSLREKMSDAVDTNMDVDGESDCLHSRYGKYALFR